MKLFSSGKNLKKKRSKIYISTQFMLVEIKIWTYKYILPEIVMFTKIL